MKFYFGVPGYFPESIALAYFEINSELLRGS